MGKLCGGQGPAEEVALSFRTVMGLKECALLLRFDALGNHALLEVLAHVNYGAHNRRAIGIGSDPMDKGLVNFQDINGKLLKIAEAGIAGAEVIHRKVNPHRFELLKYSVRGFGIFHKDAFGDLEFKISGCQGSFQEYRPDTFDKTLIAELDGGNVDGNRQRRQSPRFARRALAGMLRAAPNGRSGQSGHNLRRWARTGREGRVLGQAAASVSTPRLP